MDSREPWLSEAEALLPPRRFIRQRNAAITAVYAKLYQRNPAQFKWAGMAAFASFQVGLALEPLCLLLGLGAADAEAPDELGSHRGGLDVVPSLELIRETNNAVFADIAWAHLAFEKEGLAAVRRGVDGQPEQRRLLLGFQALDGAKRGGKVDAKQCWRGNALLLEHEQHVTVQRRFERLGERFGELLSLLTMLDFDARHSHLDRKTLSAFGLYMWTRGLPVLLRTCSKPSIVRLEHRWHWIEKSLLPKWQKVDRSDRELSSKMERLASGQVLP